MFSIFNICSFLVLNLIYVVLCTEDVRCKTLVYFIAKLNDCSDVCLSVCVRNVTCHLKYKLVSTVCLLSPLIGEIWNIINCTTRCVVNTCHCVFIFSHSLELRSRSHPITCLYQLRRTRNPAPEESGWWAPRSGHFFFQEGPFNSLCKTVGGPPGRCDLNGKPLLQWVSIPGPPSP